MTGAPVVNENGKLLGYLSQKDCLKYMLDLRYHNQAGGNVEQYMATTLMTIHPDESVLYIVELFISNNFQSYPVVDSDGILLGVITRSKALQVMLSMKGASWDKTA